MNEKAKPTPESTSTTSNEPRMGLRSGSFIGLATIQFLTVLNDNTYRWLVVPIGYVLYPNNKGFVLALGLACFVVPYILLVAPAAYLADRFSKKTVIAGTMLLQAGILVLGVIAILFSHGIFLFSTLALMGAQGALLAPARLGTIPETIHPGKISSANGILGMATVLAAVVGSVLGNSLYVLSAPLGITRLWLSGSVVIGIALLGWGASFLIIKCKPADPNRSPPTHIFKQTENDLNVLKTNLPLLAAASASAFFWFLAALAQVNVYLLGTTTLNIPQEDVGFLIAALAAGVATGSLLAGVWSAGKIEPGLVPLGAALIAITSFMMFIVAQPGSIMGFSAYYWSNFFLLLMGIGSGLYEVPLQSYLQYNSPPHARGQVLAASNFLAFSAMLIAALIFWIMQSLLGHAASIIFAVAGIITSMVFFAILFAVPHQTLQVVLRPFRWLGALTHHGNR
jgi:acyl-[acyl-carrier-protein]-phospholipid O-acyltransferase/long-chain-fatty-acid--[acyl-carrier-protein] ligase